MKPTLISTGGRPGAGWMDWRSSVAAAILLAGIDVQAASPAVARKLYDTGRYDAAQAEYQKLLREKPDDARLHFNTAASAYKKGDYSGAALGFESALATEDLKLQEQAYYNLGNTLYQLGEKAAAPDEKVGHWEQALKNFGSALTLKPEDADARNNQALVQRMLEELKKQMPKQKQPDKKDQRDKDEKDDQDDQEQDQKNQKEQKDQKDQGDPKDGQSGDKDQQQQQQQQQQQSQDKAGEDSKEPEQGAGEEGKGEKDKQAGDKQGGGKQDKKDAQAERDAEEERQAAVIGKMTPQMAEKLLDAQKGNEKAMLFRVQQQPKSKNKDRVFKDW